MCQTEVNDSIFHFPMNCKWPKGMFKIQSNICKSHGKKYDFLPMINKITLQLHYVE